MKRPMQDFNSSDAWLVRDDGNVLVGADKNEVELIVRIYNREGTVIWTVPTSVRVLEDEMKNPPK